MKEEGHDWEISEDGSWKISNSFTEDRIHRWSCKKCGSNVHSQTKPSPGIAVGYAGISNHSKRGMNCKELEVFNAVLKIHEE